MSECRSCHAEIIWAVTLAGGKRMPLDAEPIHGLFRVEQVGPDTSAIAAGPVHKSHFATCPNAAEHRRSA